MSSLSTRSSATLFLLALLLSACSTPRPGGLVRDLEVLGRGHYVDKSWIDVPAMQRADLSTIVLGEIDTSRIFDQKGISTQEGAAALRSGLIRSSDARELLELNGSGGAGRFEVAIVEMSTGDAIARVFAAELGAGHAWVQVDARVVDVDSGQVLAELSDRRRGSGVIGFRDTFGSSGPTMVREMLEKSGRDLRREIQVLFRGE